jgi:hypothetical protein
VCSAIGEGIRIERGLAAGEAGKAREAGKAGKSGKSGKAAPPTLLGDERSFRTDGI